MKSLSLNNQYDNFLLVLVVSAIFGRYGLFHPSSILSIIFLPQLCGKLKSLISGHRPLVMFFVFWLIYAFVSLAWAPNIKTGIVEMLNLFFHILLFMEIVVFSMNANRPVQTLTNAWLCAFLLTSVIAIWELSTGHHLLSAREEDLYYTNADGDFVDKDFATVTFYNRNTYCYYLCLAFPFILYYLSQCKKVMTKFASTIIMFLALYIVSKNGSRGAFLTMLIMVSVFLYYRIRVSSTRNKFFIVIAIILVVFLILVFADVLLGTILIRLSQKGLLEDNARLVLWYSSWQSFVESFGLGVGVGGMLPALEHSSYNTIYIFYSHNMLLEMLLVYGVIISLGFIGYLVRLYKRAKRIDNNYLKAVIMASLFSFPFYSVINSENLNPVFIWIFFSTLYVFSLRGAVKTIK